MARFTYKDIASFEFPDDWSDEQLQEHVKKNEKELDIRVGLASPEKKPEASFGGDIKRGAKDTYDLLRHGLPALAKSAAGNDEGARESLKAYKEGIEANEKLHPKTFQGDIGDIHDIGDFFNFAKQAVAENAASMIPVIGQAAFGGMIAKALVAKGLEKGIAAQLSSAAMRDALEAGLGGVVREGLEAGAAKTAATALPKAALKGELAGAFVGSLEQNAPETFAGIEEATAQKGPDGKPIVGTGELHPGTALGVGALKAGLDTITPMLALRRIHGDKVADGVLDRVLKKVGYTGESRLARTGVAVGEGLVTEGATEAAQESLDVMAEEVIKGSPEIFTPENLQRIATAGLAGGLSGAAFGGAGGVLSRGPQQPPVDPAGDKQETIDPTGGSIDPVTPPAAPKVKTDEELVRDALADPTGLLHGDGQLKQQALISKLAPYKNFTGKELTKILNDIHGETPLYSERQKDQTAGWHRQGMRDSEGNIVETPSNSFWYRPKSTLEEQAEKDAEEARIAKEKTDKDAAAQAILDQKAAEATAKAAGKGAVSPEEPEVKVEPTKEITSLPIETGSTPTTDAAASADGAPAAETIEKSQTPAAAPVNQGEAVDIDKNGRTKLEKPSTADKLKEADTSEEEHEGRASYKAMASELNGDYAGKANMLVDNLTEASANRFRRMPLPQQRAFVRGIYTAIAAAEDGVLSQEKMEILKDRAAKAGIEWEISQAKNGATAPTPTAAVGEKSPPPGTGPAEKVPGKRDLSKVVTDLDTGIKGDGTPYDAANLPVLVGEAIDRFNGGENLTKVKHEKLAQLAQKHKVQKSLLPYNETIQSRIESLEKQINKNIDDSKRLKDSSIRKKNIPLVRLYNSLNAEIGNKTSKSFGSRASKGSGETTKGARPSNFTKVRWAQLLDFGSKLGENPTVDKLLEVMSTSTSLFDRAITKLFSGMVNRLRQSGYNFELTIYNEDNYREAPSKLISSGKASGAVQFVPNPNGKGGTLRIMLQDSSRGKNASTDQYTAMHEMTHAVTLATNKAIREGIITDPKYLTLYKRLRDLFQYVSGTYDIAKANGETVPADDYFKTDVDEFLSEGFSNTEFLHYLANVDYETATAQSEFSRNMRQMVGLPARDQTAFDELMGILEGYENLQMEPMAEAQFFNKSKERILTEAAAQVKKSAHEMLPNHMDGTIKGMNTLQSALNSALRIAEKFPAARYFVAAVRNMYNDISRIIYQHKHYLQGFHDLTTGERDNVAKALQVLHANKEDYAPGKPIVSQHRILSMGINKGQSITLTGREQAVAKQLSDMFDSLHNMHRREAGLEPTPRNGQLAQYRIGKHMHYLVLGDRVVHTEASEKRWNELPKSFEARKRARKEALMAAYPGATYFDKWNPSDIARVTSSVSVANKLRMLEGKAIGSDIPAHEFVKGQLKQELEKSFRRHAESAAEPFVDGSIRPGQSPAAWLSETIGAYVPEAANAISRIRHNEAIFEGIERTKADGDQRLHTWAVNHYNYLRSTQEEHARIRGLAFHGLLGGNLASAVSQTFQLIQTTLPLLAAAGGPGKALAAMTRAIRIASIVQKMPKNTELFQNFGFSEAALKGLSPADQRILKDAFASGALTNTVLNQMALRNEVAVDSGQKFSKAMSNLMHASGYAFGAAELFNRMVTHLATADMYRNSEQFRNRIGLLHKESAWADQTLNEQVAAEIVNSKTQFEMGKFNKAQMYQGWLSIPTQFMSYASFMLEIYGTMFQMFNKGPEGRKMAIQGVTYLTAMMLATAGLMGLPFADNIDQLLTQLSKLMPKTFGPSFSLRYALEDMFANDMGMGRPTARSILQGPLSALSGINFSKRLGLGDIVHLDVLNGNVLSSGGPAISMAADRVKLAINDISHEHYGRALSEFIMPQAFINLRDAINATKGGRDVINSVEGALGMDPEVSRGFTTRADSKIKIPAKDVNAGDALAKGFGFSSDRIARINEEQSRELFNKESLQGLHNKYVNDIKYNLTNAYVAAYDGNQLLSDKYRQKAIVEAQAARKYNASVPLSERITKINMTELNNTARDEARGVLEDKKMRRAGHNAKDANRPLREELQKELKG